MIAEAASRSDWVLGFQDECWWTRLAQPGLFAWSESDPLRLRMHPKPPKGDGPQAVACYGVLRHDTGEMMLRFVDGRPISQVTEDFLGWVCGELAREGKKVFVLVWDNASWHVSKRVKKFIAEHNAKVAGEGGCSIVSCLLPKRAPWLNNIEPKWVHGKRAILEPDRKLSADEVKHRVCEYFKCPHEPDIKQVD